MHSPRLTTPAASDHYLRSDRFSFQYAHTRLEPRRKQSRNSTIINEGPGKRTWQPIFRWFPVARPGYGSALPPRVSAVGRVTVTALSDKYPRNKIPCKSACSSYHSRLPRIPTRCRQTQQFHTVNQGNAYLWGASHIIVPLQSALSTDENGSP